MTTGSPAVDAAVRIVSDLVGAGLRDIVLAPGSRSAPLAYAAEAAERGGAVRLHVRHDERTAGFLALGLGKGDPDHPAAVVTTSGTAVANLLPAVVEARHSGVPLLVLTADRPDRLRHTWANQTTPWQATMFGDIPVWSADVDPTEEAPGWAIGGYELAHGGLGHRPGPVHLNLRFDLPLVPDGPLDGSVSAAGPAVDEERTDEGLSGTPDENGIAHLTVGPRTVVVAGDHAGQAARDLAEFARWPLLAEPTSDARGGPCLIPAYRLVVPHLAERVERVVVYGRPTLSRQVAALLADQRVEVVQVTRYDDEPGPERPVTRASGVAVPYPDSPEWLAIWRQAGHTADDIVRRCLAEWPVAKGLHVSGVIAAATGPADALVVGASNPIRDLDLVATPLPTGARVFANRGVAGIDGTVSTALGVAMATGRPTRAFVGDLTFLHDLAALAVPVRERDGRARLQIVVANDDGGGIFETLEPHRLTGSFERVFGTPVGASMADLCAGYGIRFHRVSIHELRSLLATVPTGIEVIEVPMPRQALSALHRRIQIEVEAALTRSPVS